MALLSYTILTIHCWRREQISDTASVRFKTFLHVKEVCFFKAIEECQCSCFEKKRQKQNRILLLMQGRHNVTPPILVSDTITTCYIMLRE